MSRAHELALARMLAAYETRAPDDAVVDARKVAQHVRAMRATLDGLAGTCDAAVLATYAERIARVETMAMVCGETSTTTSSTTTTTTKRGVGRDGDEKAEEGVVVGDGGGGMLRHRRPFASNGGANGVHRNIVGVSLGNSAGPTSNHRGVERSARDEDELEKQRAIRDGLTDEMSALASGLKANALAMEKGLERSTKALEDVESKLERNVQGVKSSVKRQTAAYGANRRGSCWTWIILFVVGILFAWTYIVIKVSSDKTKLSRAAAAAAAAAAGARH